MRVEGNNVVFSNDQATNDEIDALFNTLADQQGAWARFYAIEVDSCPGELEYDRTLAAAKRLDAAIGDMMASAGRSTP
ncbi:MAG: hypothetical protein WBA40_04875 [Roseiarcus sp.]